LSLKGIFEMEKKLIIKAKGRGERGEKFQRVLFDSRGEEGIWKKK